MPSTETIWFELSHNCQVCILHVLDDDACDGNVYDLHIFVSLLQLVDGMIELSLMREDIIVQSKL